MSRQVFICCDLDSRAAAALESNVRGEEDSLAHTLSILHPSILSNLTMEEIKIKSGQFSDFYNVQCIKPEAEMW